MQNNALHLGIVQMASAADPAVNLKRLCDVAREARDRCDLLLFPEYCLCLGEGATIHRFAQTQNKWIDQMAAVAAEAAVPVLFGGVPVREQSKIYNRAIVLDAHGAVLAQYDKMHLFQLRDSDVTADETAIFAPGHRPAVFTHRGWKIGLSICYDLRFPELYRHYAPADLLICTAAFTRTTGEAHWHTLLRARAIENQTFMAAVAQCGSNPDSGTPYFGHSLVYGPWGDTVLEMDGASQTLGIAALDRERLQDVRQRIPALQNRALPAANHQS